jgi:hypothetical protein
VYSGASACACGQPLTFPENGTKPSENLLVQAEVLYETYLTSRLSHATRILVQAKMNLRRDPWNALLAKRVREAEQATTHLRVQLMAQQERSQKARQAAVEQIAPTEQTGIGPSEIITSEPFVTSQPTSTFRAAQSQRAEQIVSGKPSAANKRPAPFITQEEFNELRRSASRERAGKSRE